MTQEDKERYQRLLHAMQTGVAATMGTDPSTTPKHLRVGVNSALCDNSALALLLGKKGIITEDELDKALADMMEIEVERYGMIIKDLTGKDVTLE